MTVIGTIRRSSASVDPQLLGHHPELVVVARQDPSRPATLLEVGLARAGATASTGRRDRECPLRCIRRHARFIAAGSLGAIKTRSSAADSSVVERNRRSLRHRARIERRDLVVLQVGVDEARRRVLAGDHLDGAAIDADRLQPRAILGEVLADRSRPAPAARPGAPDCRRYSPRCRPAAASASRPETTRSGRASCPAGCGPETGRGRP